MNIGKMRWLGGVLPPLVPEAVRDDGIDPGHDGDAGADDDDVFGRGDQLTCSALALAATTPPDDEDAKEAKRALPASSSSSPSFPVSL